MKETHAGILVLTAGCLWGANGLFVHLLGEYGLGSLEMIVLRSLAAGGMLLGVLLCTREQLRVRLRDLWLFFGTGVIGVMFFNACYFACILHSTMAAAAVLLYTAPVFVTLFSRVLFQERITVRRAAALLLLMGGAAEMSGASAGSGTMTPTACILGILAAIGYALYSVFGRMASLRGYAPQTITVYTFLFAGAAGSVCIDWTHTAAILSHAPVVAGIEILFAVLIGIVPYLLYMIGIRTISPGKTSIYSSVELVSAALFGWTVLGERPTMGVCLGAAMILSAIALSSGGSVRADQSTQDGGRDEVRCSIRSEKTGR